MIPVLAEVLLRRVRAATNVTPAERADGGPRPRSAAVAADHGALRAPPRAHGGGGAPPDNARADPDDALVSLLADLAWRCLGAVTPEENNG